MAKKDTIAALTKRGISEEVATLLVQHFNSLSEIAGAGVEGLEAHLEPAVAQEVINSIGSRKATKPRAKATKAEETVEAVPEEPAVPLEEFSNRHVNTETEARLFAMVEKICESNNCRAEDYLPLKAVWDIAAKVEKDAEITDDMCVKLLVCAHEMYNDHRMVQNESAGVMAAHSIGEPGTQMNLRTFHFAGVASVSVTQGLPRLIEIVDARREPSTPSMNIPLVGLAREDRSLAELVATKIQTTTLLDVASIDTDITNLRLLIKPDARKMDKVGLTVDDVVEKLNKIKAVRGFVEKAAFDGTTENVECNIVISSDPMDPAPYTKLQIMFDAIKKAPLKGVEGIKRALLDKNNGIFSIVTEGSNLREILQVEGVDKDNVMTNSIIEIAEVFGIEAARNSIIHEATSTLKNAGLNVDPRHLMLVADLMTNDGTVRAIGRNGVSGKKSSVLARAAFEITAAHLLHAAMVGEVDKLEGVTENIIVGQPVTLGTGAVKLVYDPKKN